MTHGRVVCVTGASAGVGRAIALAFGTAGARVGLMARSAQALEAVRREIEALGGQALVLPVDVADPEAVDGAAERLVQRFGRLDIWVNNAMATVFGPVSAATAAEVRRVTEVTYLGTVHGTLAALRHMRGQNEGVIIQVGSALAYRSIPLQAAYCAAKAAVRGFTDSLRCELLNERSGIRLSMVQLPAVNTPQFDWARSHMARRARPVAPVYQPEVIAQAVVGLARRPVRELWIGRATPAAILAGFLLPALADRVAAGSAEGQLDSAAEAPGRADNLWDTPATGHRTRGRFSGEAADSALALPESRFRLALGAAAAALCATAFMAGGARWRPARLR